MKNVNEEVKRLLAKAGIDLEQEKARIRKEMEEEEVIDETDTLDCCVM